MIRHLVFAGGGPSLLQTLGALQYTEDNKFIERENIQTIYGTSAGGIVGAIYCLKYDWDTIRDYITIRPWHDVFPITIQNIFNSYFKRGLFDNTNIDNCLRPLFEAKDISMNITMSEIYEYSKIELHLFAFEMNEFEIIDISYKTHPELRLLTALQMTCGVPVLFTPVFIEDKCYIDGGVVSNYPLKYCIDAGNKNEEILGFKNKCNNNPNKITKDSTLLDYIFVFLFKMIRNMRIDDKQPELINEIVCFTEAYSITNIRGVLSSSDARKKLYENGIEYARTGIERISSCLLDKLVHETNE
uniref:PNPLA domain-containing protein n=1 Tax=viral metagenome TaxID=1070528 RepID=A0A6C0E5G8_9ZZZZ